MKRRVPRFVFPLIAVVTIPFIYNSCGKSLMGGSGFASASSTCKAVLRKGVVSRLELDASKPPAPFAAHKVQLQQDAPASMLKAKAAGRPLTISSGAQLGVIMNNQCLEQNKANLSGTTISKAVLDSSPIVTGLPTQAYLWTLDRDYTDSEIETLADQEPCVVGISWNQQYRLQSIANPAAGGAAFNDPSYPQQIDLTAINAEAAYSYFYDPSGGMATSGSPVVIAVIDTGVDWTHPDLQNNFWANSNGMGIDIPTLGTNLVNYNPFDVSDIGHGTHVAGMIAAVADNSTGIVGAMPFRAKIMAIKIFSLDSSGDLSTTSQYLYNGVQFAYLNGANVINLSLDSITDGPATDALTQSALAMAVQNGVTVITVIGNAENGQNGQLVDGSTLSSIPGEYSTTAGVIGVGSFDAATGQKSFFSHYSTTYAEIGAPGATQGTTGIYSTLPVSLGSYGSLAGTSQAGPLVSAAAGMTIGLIREAYGVDPAPSEVERLILASADKTSALSSYFKDGNRLDLLSLAQQINKDYPLTQSPDHVNLATGCP